MLFDDTYDSDQGAGDMISEEDVCSWEGEDSSSVVRKEMSCAAMETEKTFVKVVVPLLKEGIGSVNELVSMLLGIDKDLIGKADEKYNEVRHIILKAKSSLEQSESAASIQLKAVDEFYEKLTVKKAQLENQKKDSETRFGDLETSHKGQTDTMHKYIDALEAAQCNVGSCEETLASQLRKKQDAQSLIDTGAGLMAIPIFGWVAGGLMMSAGEKDLENASFAARQAEDAVRQSQEAVETYACKELECEISLQEKEEESIKIIYALREIERDIQEVSRQRTAIAEVQSNLRQAVKLLGTLAGRAKVLELQTRCFVLLSPVVSILLELLKLTDQIAGPKLLHDAGMKALTTRLHEDHTRLKAIADSPDF